LSRFFAGLAGLSITIQKYTSEFWYFYETVKALAVGFVEQLLPQDLFCQRILLKPFHFK